MSGDLTIIQVYESDGTQIVVDNTDTTVIMTVPATLNAASLSFSNDIPQNIARTGSAGTSSSVSRADHVHSIANTLLDGGNY